MSLNASLNTALSGLQVNQTLMQINSSNIANASTEGYSRKVADVSTLVVDGTGNGVKIDGVSRVVDKFLIRSVNQQTSVLSQTDAISSYYSRIQDLFGAPSDNASIAGILNTFRTELEQLAVDPSQSVNQFSTVTSAQKLVDEFNNLSDTLQSLREEVDGAIKQGVDVVNENLQTIDRLNTEIVRAKVTGAPMGELLDERDKALSAIAEQMDIKWYELDNGALHVMTGASYQLLDSEPRTINFSSPTGVSAGTVYPGGFKPIEIEDVRDDITGEIKTGKIAAMVDLRDNILPGLQDQLDQLASMVADEVNRAHSSAMPLGGLQEFEGLTQFDSSVLLDPTNTASIPLTAYNNGTTTEYGTIQFAIVDSDGNAVGQGMRVDLDEFKSAMETYVSGITGSPFTYDLTVGDIVNMLNGAYATTPPAGAVTPPTPAGWPGAVPWPPSPALTMTSTGSDIAGLTNMSGTGVTGAYSGGAFARVVNGALQIGVNSSSGYGIAIDDTLTTFDDGSGSGRSANFNYLMGLNNLFVIDDNAISAAEDISVRQDIVDDPTHLGRGHLSSTLRDPADPATEEWYVGAGDGSGATAMASVFQNQFVFASKGSLPASSQRLSEYAASVIQASATNAQNASDNYDFQKSLMSELQTRQGEVSGVNIDEELAGLIVIQNAYAASSRIVSTVNSMYDDLLNMV